ncbi:MAG: hypothetical protein MR874_01215 [Coriobacteriaceae bacterium]|uniref:hypothetical protein n=1 Tax=Tractidigestivibacter sp. TaxID=2847320 RepID=UPI002A82DA77|nr:hypothetical protein [Tractidigestivibacter sp.]MCI6274797.1 hypothetical protein [Coriobacteriaceae bacterium]MCI6547595.1 hypothetical protein [Coriobacteriaceae bacterium]MCI6843367.1 hypothetical protein [Coriobacteriaceae bacterium]MCI7438438.1 hypothetical protein [Coriobacteriaceae bacterium]MDD7583985.1 hypothetical protein [Coriobacteriaceae bacterium]
MDYDYRQFHDVVASDVNGLILMVKDFQGKASERDEQESAKDFGTIASELEGLLKN